ncbi:hypothetical protein AB3S75_039024 [Citrus x aurantiifolia]
MGYGEVITRSYDRQIDRARVEDLERRCEVGPAERVFLFTDTLGDPICRIRNSPMYKMLVAELDRELVGVIQGSIKQVTVQKPHEDLAKVGYVLGLRVAPLHRRKGIGSSLVCKLEEWFTSNDVDYAYMATEKDNEASVKLFVNKLGYVNFRTPAILVHPVNNRMFHTPSNVQIRKLKIEEAENLYYKFMASTEFFPYDIGNILRNKLSLGTWVAYPRGEIVGEFGSNGQIFPKSWAMVSVWNSGELFKLRFLSSIWVLFHVWNAQRRSIIRQNEVGGSDALRLHIPHWKLLSCPEDLWCIKALKNEKKKTLRELTKIPPTIALFVDPREV